MNELRMAYEDIDTNNSGAISRRELKRVFNYLDIRASDDEIDVVMNQMDTNDNGKIEFEEFANVMAKSYYKKHSKMDLVEAFK